MKLYIITRTDLAPGAQLAQSCHAMHTFCREYPEVVDEWQKSEGGGNLVCLAVPTEEHLDDLATAGAWEKVPYSQFHEPDFGGELTAVAVLPRDSKPLRSMLACLRLALPKPKPMGFLQTIGSVADSLPTVD